MSSKLTIRSRTRFLVLCAALCGVACSSAPLQKTNDLGGAAANGASNAGSGMLGSAGQGGSGAQANGNGNGNTAGVGALAGISGGVSGDGASAGTGESGGSGGVGAAGESGAGAGAGGGAGVAPMCMKGTTKASQVVMIGDSYLALSGDITTVLEGKARAAGALGATEQYRTYYVSGTSLGNGQIPSQFDNALLADKNIKFVLMDGGGNDILLLNSMCLSLANPETNASCMASVEGARKTGATLLQKMADNGVEQVIWFGYPDLNPGGLAGSMPAKVNDYATPIMKDMCEHAPLPCHFIDTRASFMGHIPQYIGIDGVHPTLAGSTVIAELMWSTMQAECIAQ